MVEGVAVRTNEGYNIILSEDKFFGGNLGRVMAAVCPGCGYVETYLESTDRLNKKLLTDK